MSVKYVAVDVDGTLTHSNVSFAFGRFLYQKGIASFFQVFLPVLYYGIHSLGWLSVEQLHRSIFRVLFSGRKREQIELAVDEFLTLHGNQLIRPSIRKELSLLQQQRCKIALLSSSPDFLVRKVASMLGIEDWAATAYEVDERGFFTGIGRIVTGEVKAQIVKHVKAQEGATVLAMTDSMLDMPLLEAADEVVAVFPDRKLRRCAKERGWRIVNSG
jgi:HAD superfamily phosphoserine phosphatase-like hydrolase